MTIKSQILINEISQMDILIFVTRLARLDWESNENILSNFWDLTILTEIEECKKSS